MAVKEEPLVSVMMPLMNGELLLSQALDSLLAQDYRNIEIIILDNLSTDRTPEICREYARRDPRIRYVPDSTNRITHDAANHLATLIRGKYCMLACDDDLWATHFLRTLVDILEAHPEVGLAYANVSYVDLDGHRSDRRFLRGRRLYSRRDTSFSNFWDFVVHRHVVPLVFGVFRTSEYLKALPWDTFDETIADVDNLFVLKILSQSKVQSADEVLFFYRDKYRWADPDLLPSYPKNENPLKVWLYNVQHQLRFTKKIMGVIRKSSFSLPEKFLLYARMIYAFVRYFTIAKVRHALAVVLGRTQRHLQKLDAAAVARHEALLSITERSKAGPPGEPSVEVSKRP